MVRVPVALTIGVLASPDSVASEIPVGNALGSVAVLKEYTADPEFTCIPVLSFKKASKYTLEPTTMLFLKMLVAGFQLPTPTILFPVAFKN